jgi:hypothetical protein
MDLYSTFFGTSVNDEIERRLFGDIDGRGSKAVRAFAGADVSEWHRQFQTLFEYIDIQKIRTPKGLDWLKSQYPTLTQNELMREMQGIRMMHCTIWTEGVREIISAEDADVKFIISDHPVTIYNHAVPPEARTGAYPHDPAITQKTSQTIFPLTRDFCLILTNLEYAKDPSTSPLDKRTFARNYRNSMVRTDAFIRTRKLSGQEVTRVNYVLKARARRYIAAGRKEWLYPEEIVSDPWGELRKTLLPPKDELWHFGGEMFVKYEDGHVHYQDEFGRTEKQREFLRKDPPVRPLRPDELCGCGYGRPFKECCKSRPIALRPTWSERSINVMKFAPNFEIAMYLAQATGSCIVTDSLFRWKEIRSAIYRRVGWSSTGLSALAHSIEGSIFAFPQNVADIEALASDKAFASYPALMRDLFKYLLKLGDRGPKPNLEEHLAARFARAHSLAQAAIKNARIPAKEARISCVFPPGGIQDNTVNRLLLMSSSERHLPSVPMAFLIEGQAFRGTDLQAR